MSTNGIEIHRDFNDNLTRVYLGDRITVWFSYTTVVAFAISGEGTFKTDRNYSPTTRKHLNSIAAHTLSAEEFDARLNTFLARLSGALDNSTEVVSTV